MVYRERSYALDYIHDYPHGWTGEDTFLWGGGALLTGVLWPVMGLLWLAMHYGQKQERSRRQLEADLKAANQELEKIKRKEGWKNYG